MATSSEIVRTFLNAFYTGDHAAAREHLADDVRFVGPSASFNTAEEYARVSAHVAAGVRALEIRKLFEDGSEVGAFYDLIVDHAAGVIPIAEWYQLRGNRIVSIRLIMDTSPFVAHDGEPPDSAVEDPVCHMRIQPTAAAASREHQASMYYFCSPGCAAAFEAEPSHYITGSR